MVQHLPNVGNMVQHLSNVGEIEELLYRATCNVDWFSFPT